MALTDGLKLPIPELTETADGPDAFSDLAGALEDYVYDRILPADVVRAPMHYWGSGNSYPTTGVKIGDTYRQTALGSALMVATAAAGTTWRQLEVPSVASNVARDAISTGSAALLYPGFRLITADTNRTWMWSGSTWWLVAGPAPHCSLYMTNNQIANASVWTPVAWDSEEFDTDNGHATNATEYIIPVTGYWLVYANVSWNTYAAGARFARLARRIPGGSALPIRGSSSALDAVDNIWGPTQVPTPKMRLALNAGDAISAEAWQNGIAQLNIVGATQVGAQPNYASMMQITYDGA